MILADRRLLVLSVAPMLIDLVLLVATGAVLFFKLDDLVYAIVKSPDSWLDWALAAVLFVVFGLVGVALLALLFVVIGTVLASPFLDAISARTEVVCSGRTEDDSGGLGQVLQDIARSVGGALKKIALIVAVQIVILPLAILPAIGQVIYPLLASFASFVFVGWEFLDFPWDRWRWSYRQKKEFIKRHLLSTAALGLSISALLFLPVMNLALMPAAACGATLWALSEGGEDHGYAKGSPEADKQHG